MAEQQDHLDFPAPPEVAGELPAFEMELDQRSQAFGYEPSPPQYLNIDEARETLSKKIIARPSREELMKMNILKEFHSAPLLHAKQGALQRARVEDTLQRRIPNRPSRETLQAQNILKTTRVGPVIQSSREALARASLTERLNGNISQRPGIMDLVLDQIIQTDPGVFELIASEAVDPGSEVATPMPDAPPAVLDFDLLDTNGLPAVPPAPPIPPPAWNISSMTLPTTQASLFGLSDRSLSLGLESLDAGVDMGVVDVGVGLGASVGVSMSVSVDPTHAHVLSPSLPPMPTPVVSAPQLTPILDPLVRRPTEAKIKKFRYHEYKYPAEKPKRPTSQSKRRPSKAQTTKAAVRAAADEQVLLPAGVGYETAVQQQARFLHLMQQAQESPILPNFGPDGNFAVSMSPGAAHSPLHDLLLDSVSPGTPAPHTPEHHFRSGSSHGNVMHPTVVVPPRAANPAPTTLQPPRTHGHNRASSWGGGFAKTASLPVSFGFQVSPAPATPAMPVAPRATPPILRAQSLLVVQQGSPLAGPGTRPPVSHIATLSSPMTSTTSAMPPITLQSLSLPPFVPLAPTSADPALSLPPLSISTTLASHPPPHELGQTSFGFAPHSFQFEETFTNADTLPDFDFSSPVILPDMHLV